MSDALQDYMEAVLRGEAEITTEEWDAAYDKAREANHDNEHDGVNNRKLIEVREWATRGVADGESFDGSEHALANLLAILDGGAHVIPTAITLARAVKANVSIIEMVLGKDAERFRNLSAEELAEELKDTDWYKARGQVGRVCRRGHGDHASIALYCGVCGAKL